MTHEIVTLSTFDLTGLIKHSILFFFLEKEQNFRGKEKRRECRNLRSSKGVDFSGQAVFPKEPLAPQA